MLQEIFGQKATISCCRDSDLCNKVNSTAKNEINKDDKIMMMSSSSSANLRRRKSDYDDTNCNLGNNHMTSSLAADTTTARHANWDLWTLVAFWVAKDSILP